MENGDLLLYSLTIYLAPDGPKVTSVRLTPTTHATLTLLNRSAYIQPQYTFEAGGWLVAAVPIRLVRFN